MISVRTFWVVFWVVVILILGGLYFAFTKTSGGQLSYSEKITSSASGPASTASSSPEQVLLSDGYYVSQTFNNCGPAALSMDLFFYGINVSQQVLADALRPDHNTTGKNDEKSTQPSDIATQAQTYGLVAYYRPAGNITLLKKLLSGGFPVMVRTLFMPTDQVAHYRVVIGYDDATTTPTITDEDGFQGPKVVYSDADFMSLWKYYDYEYIVLATPAEQSSVENILGADVATSTAWQNAKQIAENDLNQNASDTLATFNLSVADYYLGDYLDSVNLYEFVASLIPPNTLWYEPEPIYAYYELGDYDTVFSMTENIFSHDNPAYPELYVIRGESDLKEGNVAAAKNEFEAALKWNPNLKSAKDALAALGSN